MKFCFQEHRYQSFHLLPAVSHFVSSRKDNSRRQCENDLASIVFQEGIPIRIAPMESVWEWQRDVTVRSFVLYEVNGDLVSLASRSHT